MYDDAVVALVEEGGSHVSPDVGTKLLQGSVDRLRGLADRAAGPGQPACGPLADGVGDPTEQDVPAPFEPVVDRVAFEVERYQCVVGKNVHDETKVVDLGRLGQLHCSVHEHVHFGVIRPLGLRAASDAQGAAGCGRLARGGCSFVGEGIGDFPRPAVRAPQ